MKNLSHGIPVENVKATCDFCFEEDKECLRSPKQRDPESYLDTKIVYPEEYKVFGDNSIKHEFEYEDIEIEPFDICHDCVVQLFTFIDITK